MIETKSHRIESLDILRGLVMVIMALDHSRDYFHATSFTDNPLNLATTTPLLFFTRWITHFCAPVFVFLAGVSVYLQGSRKSKSELSIFLLKRGAWLVLIEMTVVSLAWTFNVHYDIIIMQVIWAIGASMIVLGILIRLPYSAILATGLLLIIGHNVLDFSEAHHHGPYSLAYDLFFHGNFGFHHFFANHNFMVIYGALPWTGIMLLGYAFGKLYAMDDTLYRKKFLVRAGAGLLLFFIVLRFLNVYGDPAPWSVQPSPVYTFFSFINVTKYPPSLLYTCVTLGPALLFLAFSETARSRISKILVVYGRVPFLYYIVHLYLLHFISAIFFLSRGHTFAEALVPNGAPFLFFKAGEGYGLLMVYLVWIALVIVLYPMCKWFSDYKKSHRQWWLSYL
jgi:uncharacterized membrane protein